MFTNNHYSIKELHHHHQWLLLNISNKACFHCKLKKEKVRSHTRTRLCMNEVLLLCYSAAWQTKLCLKVCKNEGTVWHQSLCCAAWNSQSLYSCRMMQLFHLVAFFIHASLLFYFQPKDAWLAEFNTFFSLGVWTVTLFFIFPLKLIGMVCLSPLFSTFPPFCVICLARACVPMYTILNSEISLNLNLSFFQSVSNPSACLPASVFRVLFILFVCSVVWVNVFNCFSSLRSKSVWKSG